MDFARKNEETATILSELLTLGTISFKDPFLLFGAQLGLYDVTSICVLTGLHLFLSQSTRFGPAVSPEPLPFFVKESERGSSQCRAETTINGFYRPPDPSRYPSTKHCESLEMCGFAWTPS